MNYSIALSSLSKSFSNGADFALKDINLQVSVGEKIGIVGENGAGKTTLLKLIAGSITPSSGSITTNGAIECLFDSSVLLDPVQSPLQISKDFLYLKGISSREMDPYIADIQDFCSIGDRFYDPFYTLSLGMKARVQFAIKTSLTSEIVLVDEVLGAGDTTMALKASKRIKKISESSTFICVSHSLSHIRAFTNRCLWIKNQSIYMDGSTKDVLNCYETYMNQKIEDSLGHLQAPSSVQKNTSSASESPYSAQFLGNLFKCLSANDGFHQNGRVLYTKNLSPISYSESVQLIATMQSDSEILSLSYYHQEKPHRISFPRENIIQKTENFVLGDGKWLLAICKLSSDFLLEYHLFDVFVPPTNHSDPPLIIINPKIYLNDYKSLSPYLSSRC